MRFWVGGAVIAAAIVGAVSGSAAVSEEQAAALGGKLTPLGADRAGNADGSIPAWTGGLRQEPGGSVVTPRPDPFPNEAPLFTITAANVQAYADKLPDGAKALFARFPDYRMNIYPSHRTAAAPQSVYDATKRNAVTAKAGPAGIARGITGAAGGIPFPLPQNGFEAMWNHLLAYWGPAREVRLSTYVVSSDGTLELATAYREVADFPYYYPGATPETIGDHYFKTRHLDDAPPEKVGQGYLAWQPLDIDRANFAAWRILPGEHRVRKGPALSYDTPDPDASGYVNLDEYYLFFGGLDRYEFKLLGKREMYVPYNNNRFYARPVRAVAGPKHADPDALRYELHRVWVVEGTLAAGEQHVSPRRRFYLDEDTWLVLYSDSWDEEGRLWKFGHATTYLMPETPALILGSHFVYDLVLGGYVYSFAFNEEPDGYRITAPHSADLFTPEAFAAQAVR